MMTCQSRQSPTAARLFCAEVCDSVCDFQKKLLCRSSGIPNVRICKNSVDDWKILENVSLLHLFDLLLLSMNGVRHVL